MPSTYAEDDGASSPVPTTTTITGVTTRQERRTAAGHWLLTSAPSLREGRRQWSETGAAWLRPGALFTAVTVPAPVIHAAAGAGSPQGAATYVQDALDGGPSFYAADAYRGGGGYTFLLPLSAVRSWYVLSTTVHPPNALLLVPSPHSCEPLRDGPWWVSPLESAGDLCSAPLLASLAGLGRRRLGPFGGELR